MAFPKGVVMNILIVDDDFDNRDILKTRLETSGHRVVEASNGRECLDRAHVEHFDLILLDLMMPQMDGWQTCKVLKENDATKHIPVIVLTARVTPMDELRTWECGVDDYLPKPIDFTRLGEIIQKLTANKQGERP